MPAPTRIIVKRKKFFPVKIPITDSEIELVGDSIEALDNKTINLDLTRQLRGKSVEATLKVKVKDNSAVAEPVKIVLMPYFIRRMIRKNISYVEDSFSVPSQENLVKIKPFLITRKKVSRAVRKTLRNLTKNWIEDYVAERKNQEIFEDIFSNKLQRALSLKLKKTYPLSLCEVRFLEILRPLEPSEIPEIKKKKIEIERGIDQMAEIEEEKIKKAEKEIEKAQEMALKVEKGEETPEEVVKETEEGAEKETKKETSEKKKKQDRKTKEKKSEKKRE